MIFFFLLDPNPLCACPLPQVVELFKKYFDLSLMDVKDDPTLKIAFEILMERKNEVLTSFEWTRTVFAYMNGLEGMGAALKEQISELAFIPLRG
jgi:hypothetical protein